MKRWLLTVPKSRGHIGLQGPVGNHPSLSGGQSGRKAGKGAFTMVFVGRNGQVSRL